MNTSEINNQLIALAAPPLQETGEEKLERVKAVTERKIHLFVQQNLEAFNGGHLAGLQSLRERAVSVGAEGSSTVQMIDGVIQRQSTKIKQIQEGAVRKFEEVMGNLTFYDPSQLRYEADALWAMRDAHPELMHNNVIPTVVHGFYQAAAFLAEKQLGKEAVEEYRDLSRGVMGASSTNSVTYIEYTKILKSFLKEGSPSSVNSAFKIAEAHFQLELLTPQFTHLPESIPLFKAAQTIFRAHGTPCEAIEDQLRLDRRSKTSFLAQLPRTVMEELTQTLDLDSLANLLDTDPALGSLITPKQASAMLEKIDETKASVKPEVYYRLAVVAGEEVLDLNLSMLPGLTDAKLKTLLQACPNLENLNLSGCTQITWKGFKQVAQYAPQLKGLSLAYCTQMTDSMVFELRALKNLENLNVRGCVKLTNHAIYAIAQMGELNTLTLAELRITGGILHTLNALGKLRHLSVAQCTLLTEESLLKLPPLEMLKLDLVPNVSDQTLHHLKTMPNLKELSLIGSLQARAFTVYKVQLGDFPKLESLNISNNLMENPENLLGIYALPHLRHLYAKNLINSIGEDVPLIYKTPFVMGAAAILIVANAPWLKAASAIIAFPGAIGEAMMLLMNLFFSSTPPDANRPNLEIHT